VRAIQIVSESDHGLELPGPASRSGSSVSETYSCSHRPMRRSSQRGVALVITLIMLALVTVMAILFLGISRRERAQVIVMSDYVTAKLMSDEGAARAEADLLGGSPAIKKIIAYDMRMTTNYIQPTFTPFVSAYTNVSYLNQFGLGLSLSDRIRQNLTNLFYDPRPPVYVVTNANTGGTEFRFYHDINRNGRFDTNGWQPVYTSAGIVGTNFIWGDPEWIGVLEHPDRSHTSSNRFIGRYAYVVVHAGKTLDLNFIHNRAKQGRGNAITGSE